MKQYDVLVAGGGLAGVAAAVSSARMGARTLLIERYGFLGGMATAGLVNPFMTYYTSTGVALVAGFLDNLCDKMRAMGGMMQRAFDPEAMKFATQELVLESGAELQLHSLVSGARVHGGKLVGVAVLTKSGAVMMDASCVVDCTGDADVAAMAGVPYDQGDKEQGLSQAMTLMFTVGGVDLRGSLTYAKDHPDEMRFPKPPDGEAVERMLKGTISIAGFYSLVQEAHRKGEFTLPQDLVFFLSLPVPGQVVVNTTHIGGLDGTDSGDLTKAEIEGRRQAIQVMNFLRNYIPGFENAYLLQTAPQIGVRETRRILGEYVFGREDVARGAKFPDAVLRSAYPVDVHSATGKGYARDEEPGLPGTPPPGDWYEVPYRCLVPQKIDNLLVAGRCISATHEGQGAVRIMASCIALGQAAGSAAALCAEKGITPRKLDTALLRKKLLEQGAIV